MSHHALYIDSINKNKNLSFEDLNIILSLVIYLCKHLFHFLLIFSNFFILSILTLTSNVTSTDVNQNGAKKMLKNNAICSGKLVTYSFPEEKKISCVKLSLEPNNYTSCNNQ